jgi:hypothetical protein
VYVVINATAQSVKLVGVTGPTSGVTMVTGEKAVCAWNGSDFVKVASSVADGVTTIDFGSTGLTPATATSGAVTVAGTLAPANGGTGVSNNAAMTVTGSGNFAYTRTLTGATNVTFPTTGTLSTLAGSETLTNKTINGSNNTVTNISLTAGVTGTLPATNGGTGVANNAASTLTISGNFGTTLTVSGTTGVTLPTTGTLSTLAGSETLTNKTLTSPTLTTPALGTPASGVLSACTVDGTNAVGYRAIPLSGTAKTTSYTLATGDVGELVQVNTGGSIIVPDAVFATGDAVVIFNNTSGAITLTMSITTAYIGGTDADKATISLATRGICNVLFISGTVCVVTGNVT